jgi:hypothetical protein
MSRRIAPWAAAVSTSNQGATIGPKRCHLDARRHRGNEVVNPFNLTEVCVKLDGAWKLASLSFTRLLTPQ